MVEFIIYLSGAVISGALLAWGLRGFTASEKRRFYESQLEAERVKLEECRHQIEILQDFNKEKEQNLIELRADIQDGEAQFAEFQIEADEEKQKFATMHGKLKELEQRQEDYYFRLDSITGELDDKNSYIVSLEQQLLTRNQQFHNFQEALAKEKTRRAEAELQNETLSNTYQIELGTLRQNVAELREEFAKSEALREELTEKLPVAESDFKFSEETNATAENIAENVDEVEESITDQTAETPVNLKETDEIEIEIGEPEKGEPIDEITDEPDEINSESDDETAATDIANEEETGATDIADEAENFADNISLNELSDADDLTETEETDADSVEISTESPTISAENTDKITEEPNESVEKSDEDENFAEVSEKSENKMFSLGEVAAGLFATIPKPLENEENKEFEVSGEDENSILETSFGETETNKISDNTEESDFEFDETGFGESAKKKILSYNFEDENRESGATPNSNEAERVNLRLEQIVPASFAITATTLTASQINKNPETEFIADEAQAESENIIEMPFNNQNNNEYPAENSAETASLAGENNEVKVVETEAEIETETAQSEEISTPDVSESVLKAAFVTLSETETPESSPVKKIEEEPETAIIEVKAETPEVKTETPEVKTETVEIAPEPPSRLLQLLSAEDLPEIPQKDAARLQLQSPNRIWLYWSLGKNPYTTLEKAFGARAKAYSISLRLTDLESNESKFFAGSMSGSYWFNDVKAGAKYKVDLGFAAPNRPFIRLLSSNTVETPRPAPSPRIATDADFAVRVPKFVEILEASGYSHQTAPLRFATSNANEADAKTLSIVQRLSAGELPSLEGVNLLELRWALLSLLAGVSLDEVKKSVSPELVAWLSEVNAQNADALKPENVKTIMQSVIGEDFVQAVVSGNVETRKKYVSKVFGGSAVEVFETIVPNAVEFPIERLFPAEITGELDAPTSR